MKREVTLEVVTLNVNDCSTLNQVVEGEIQWPIQNLDEGSHEFVYMGFFDIVKRPCSSRVAFRKVLTKEEADFIFIPDLVDTWIL